MGLAELEKKIRGDAEAEISQISKDGEKRLGEIRGDYNEQADLAYNEIVVKGKRDAFLMGKKIITAAKIEAQAMMTDEKNRVINQVFAKSKERILKLPQKKKSEMLGKLLKDRSLIDGTAVIHVDKKYKSLLKSPKDVSIKTGQIDDFGVIIESSDGRIRIDNRLGSVFGDMRENVKPRLNKILFDTT